MTDEKTVEYLGDCTAFDHRRILGPDQTGTYYRQATAAYSPANNRTTITLQPIPPAELARIVETDKTNTYNRLHELADIMHLFGTEQP